MSALKSFVFGGSSPSSAGTELGMLVLRVFAGLSMALAHGLGKVPPPGGFVDTVESLGMPAPVFFAWAAGLSELVGGLCLAAGFATRISATLIFATMIVAAFGVHGDDGFEGMEMALLFAAAVFPFILSGSGRVGVDSIFRQG